MWQEKNGLQYKEYEFPSFDDAFNFIRLVAIESEKAKLHPKWEHHSNTVKIWLDSSTADSQTAQKMIESLYRQGRIDNVDEQTTTHLNAVKLFADGGSRGNPGPSASGFAVLDMNNKVLVEKGVYLGVTTNNQAEYQALRLGLEEIKQMNIPQVQVYMDSLLVINQMLGKFKVRNRDLWPIHDSIRQLVKHFKRVSFQHVPRELNKLADALVNQALDQELSG